MLTLAPTATFTKRQWLILAWQHLALPFYRRIADLKELEAIPSDSSGCSQHAEDSSWHTWN